MADFNVEMDSKDIPLALKRGLSAINPPAQYNDCPTGKALADLPNGFYRCIGGNYPWLPQGAPSWGTVRVWHYVDWFDADYRDIYGRSWALVPAYSGSNPWQEYATATLPQEFDLPLVAGLRASAGYASKYRKNLFSEVFVHGRIEKSGTSDDIPNGSHILTLPQGFRPASKIIRQTKSTTASQGVLMSDLVIETDGTAKMYMPVPTSCQIVSIDIDFLGGA